MQFNPNPNKQANEAIFSRKSKVHSYPPLNFNNNDVNKCPHQKHLGIILDLKFEFNIRFDNKIRKYYKIISIIKPYYHNPSIFRDKLYLSSTNPSSNHIWSMEIYYMINQKIKIFRVN